MTSNAKGFRNPQVNKSIKQSSKISAILEELYKLLGDALEIVKILCVSNTNLFSLNSPITTHSKLLLKSDWDFSLSLSFPADFRLKFHKDMWHIPNPERQKNELWGKKMKVSRKSYKRVTKRKLHSKFVFSSSIKCC